MVEVVVGNLLQALLTRYGNETRRVAVTWGVDTGRVGVSISISSVLLTWGRFRSLQMSRNRAINPAGIVTIHTST